MLTKAAHGLLIAATSLLTLGLATGNPILLGLTGIPVAAFALGVLQGPPRVVGGELVAPNRARAGDVIDVQARIVLDGPPGLVTVVVQLPPEFALVEGGNAHILTKGRGRETAEVRFRVRAAKRGRYLVGPAQIAALPPAGLKAASVVEAGSPVELEVFPRVVPVRRLRGLRGTAATIAPEEDVARIGLQTTDFLELREYRWGDPPRAVNWKATARHAGASQVPLVNEYEVEGRKSVFFLMDAGRHMAVGTTVENGFEVAIAAVSALALAYIDRGYKVGFYAYNALRQEPLYPDVGARQFLKLQRVLSQLEPGDGTEGPLAAVQRCRVWLLSAAPMAVFVTRTEMQTQQLEDSVRKVLAFGARRRPVLVVEPQAFHLVPGDEATEGTARLLSQLARPRHQRLRRLGAIVIPWNPRLESLEKLLFRGVAP